MATTCRYRSNSAGDHSGAVSGTINGAGRGGSSGKVPPTVADPASGEAHRRRRVADRHHASARRE
jgi:hypothetical protein